MTSKMHSVTKGKRSEFYIMATLLEHGFRVFQTLVDTEGIDCIVLGEGNKKYFPIQIKSREEFTKGDLVSIENLPEDMFVIIYDIETRTYWIIPSNEYLKLSRRRVLTDGTIQHRLSYTKKNGIEIEKYREENGISSLRSRVHSTIP